MPLYEYRCKACGELEEKLEGLSAPTEHDCPKCGVGVGMQRQISQVAFSLSGDGWYAQGYSNKEGKKGEPSSPTETTAPAVPSTGGCCGGSCTRKHEA